ncbi:hypothetical protein P9112_006616 [Eukaryota sp. TZLM1-RC]
MSLYVRIRRLNRTIFFNVAFNETLMHVLERLTHITNIPPDQMRLYKDGAAMDLDSTVSDLDINNDDLLILTYAEVNEDGNLVFEDPEFAKG